MNLDKISSGLFDNLLINSIFYFIVDEEFTTAVIPDVFTNDCYKDLIVNIDGDKFLYRVDDIDIVKIHQKGILLDSNLYKILELKNELNGEVYKYIFENYLERIITLLFINQIVIKNAPINQIINTPEIIKCLKLNYSLLTSHKDRIIGIEPELSKRIINSNILVESDNEVDLDYGINSNQTKSSIKELKSFLVHDKKEEIVKIVKEHFSDFRGISLRYLIEYFISKKILVLNTGDKKAIYRSFEILFDSKNIAHYNSIFAKDIFNKDDINYKNLELIFNRVFDKILNANPDT